MLIYKLLWVALKSKQRLVSVYGSTEASDSRQWLLLPESDLLVGHRFENDDLWSFQAPVASVTL